MTGFTSPQYTQTPNDLFDIMMRDMEKSELKVVLAVIRKTLGFHTRNVRMSIRDIQEMTGLSVGSVYAGTEAAATRGVLIKSSRGGVTEWRINWNDQPNDPVEHGILEAPPILSIVTPVLLPVESGVTTTVTPSIKETSKETPKETKTRPTSEEAQKTRTRTILEAQGIDTTDLLSHVGSSRLNQGHIDVSQFPEHCQITIERFCRLWRAQPPEKVVGRSGAFGDWINGARDLMTAYGEYGPELLDVVYWSGDWLRADGTPMTIGRPGGILQFVSGWCGSLRQRGIKPEQLSEQVERLRPQFAKKASPEVLGVAMENYAERLARRKQIELDARAKAK